MTFTKRTYKAATFLLLAVFISAYLPQIETKKSDSIGFLHYENSYFLTHKAGNRFRYENHPAYFALFDFLKSLDEKTGKQMVQKKGSPKNYEFMRYGILRNDIRQIMWYRSLLILLVFLFFIALACPIKWRQKQDGKK